jgi:succinate-acetate transporter protein
LFLFVKYLTYDANSFIADVGGYCGLLLGQSVIAFYDAGLHVMTIIAKRVENLF